MRSEIASIYKTTNIAATKKDRVNVLKSVDYIDYISTGGRLGLIDYFRVARAQREFNGKTRRNEMKALSITKTNLQKAQIERFESLEEMKLSGYSDRNFRVDCYSHFVVIDRCEDGELKRHFILDDKIKGIRIFCNSPDVDILFKINRSEVINKDNIILKSSTNGRGFGAVTMALFKQNKAWNYVELCQPTKSDYQSAIRPIENPNRIIGKSIKEIKKMEGIYMFRTKYHHAQINSNGEIVSLMS